MGVPMLCISAARLPLLAALLLASPSLSTGGWTGNAMEHLGGILETPELPRPDVSDDRAADWLDLTPGLSDSQESMRRLANTPAPPEGTAWMMPTRSNLRGRHPRWHLTRYGWNEFTETS